MSKLKRQYFFKEIQAVIYKVPLPKAETRVVGIDGEEVQQYKHVWQAQFFGQLHTHVSDVSEEDVVRIAEEAFGAIDQSTVDPSQYRTNIAAMISGRETPTIVASDVLESSAKGHIASMMKNGIVEMRPSMNTIYPPHMITQISYNVSQF
jgi:hypothetical protein